MTTLNLESDIDNAQDHNGKAIDIDAEYMRQTAWEIGERQPAAAFIPLVNHVALAMVNPCRGFAHWRISPEWIEETRCRKADFWHNSRMILRLYDVSYITFNGFNANSICDHLLPSICGQMFFDLDHAGTWQLAEVGFLLTTGEFIPAARSNIVAFPRASASSYTAQEALLVTNDLKIEPIENIWEQERILKERRMPRLRHPLRIALLCLTLDKAGLPEFVVKLGNGLGEQGHDVHILTSGVDDPAACQSASGVRFHNINISYEGAPYDVASRFQQAAEQRLGELGQWDIVHFHEWLSAAALQGPHAKVCSLTSLEATRRNGAPASAESLVIEEKEREILSKADVLLMPGWLRHKANLLRIDAPHIHEFGMEGRAPNEWDSPLDFGEVKRGINFGPLDRMILFVGPLEHAAGPDLLLEAMPVLLQRTPDVRLAFAGAGDMLGVLQNRAHQLGIAYAVRFLGHVERSQVVRLLRASEALVLPSRYRVPFDDAVVDMARAAGRAVITTHGGPAHLVRHEETGLVTYDNPGSMVWAVDRILSDPAHARRLGENGRRNEKQPESWSEVARHYLEVCAASFPQLTELPSY